MVNRGGVPATKLHVMYALAIVFSSRVTYLIRRLISANSQSFLRRGKVRLEECDYLDLLECEGNHPRTYVLVSLYRFKQHIPGLVESIRSNTCRNIEFRLLLVQPNDDEKADLLSNLNGVVNCESLTFENRISIYSAWNAGISSIEDLERCFVTNLNADDLRRPKAICAQAKHLAECGKHVSFGDVAVIEEEAPLSWGALPKKGFKTNLQEFRPGDLLLRSQNLPHSAPIWKGSLHTRVGLFSEDYVSSGDAEFWLRCQLEGVTFAKLNIVTSVYFSNPDGLSTKWNSKGFQEWNRALYQVCKLRPKAVIDLVRLDRGR